MTLDEDIDKALEESTAEENNSISDSPNEIPEDEPTEENKEEKPEPHWMDLDKDGKSLNFQDEPDDDGFETFNIDMDWPE